MGLETRERIVLLGITVTSMLVLNFKHTGFILPSMSCLFEFSPINQPTCQVPFYTIFS